MEDRYHANRLPLDIEHWGAVEFEVHLPAGKKTENQDLFLGTGHDFFIKGREIQPLGSEKGKLLLFVVPPIALEKLLSGRAQPGAFSGDLKESEGRSIQVDKHSIPIP